MNPFYDRERARLALLPRLSIYLLAVILLWAMLALILAPGGFPSVWQRAQTRLLMAVIALLSAWVACRLLDRRAFAELGFGMKLAWWRDCVIGCLIGGFCALLPFLLALMLGWVEVLGTWKKANPQPSFWMQITPELLFLLGIAIAEETVFRGYLLTNLQEGFTRGRFRRVGTTAAVLLSSLLFALLHVGNTGIAMWSLVGLSLMGVAWALWRVLSQSLAMPLGAHVAINLVYFNVLGGMGPGGDLGSHTTLLHTSWRSGGFLSTGLALSWMMVTYLASQVLMLALGSLWIQWRARPQTRCQ